MSRPLNLGALRGFQLTSVGDGFAVGVPQDLAFFAGHFPGAPIVPGAALLQLALQQAEVVGDAVRLERVRFSEPVGPGATLTLRIAAREGRTSFTYTAGDKPVAQGSWVAAAMAPGSPIPVDTPPATLPDPRDLLPHRAPAVLLTALLAHAPTHLAAHAHLAADSPFLAGPWASAACIEAAAQAAAAHGGLTATADGPTRRAQRGYLVGVKSALLHRTLPQAATLQVAVERTGSAGALAIYAASVSCASLDLLRGELSVYVVPAEASA